MDYDYVDELLKERGMSRRKLADEAGIKQSSMSMWFLRKTRKVPNQYLSAIAHVLQVPEWEIMHPLDKQWMHSVSEEQVKSYMAWEEHLKEEKRKFMPQGEYTDEMLVVDFHKLSPDWQESFIERLREILYETGQLDVASEVQG